MRQFMFPDTHKKKRVAGKAPGGTARSGPPRWEGRGGGRARRQAIALSSRAAISTGDDLGCL